VIYFVQFRFARLYNKKYNLDIDLLEMVNDLSDTMNNMMTIQILSNIKENNDNME